MSLINCPNCQELVSDSAMICPHCGNLVDEKNAKTSRKRLPSKMQLGFIIIAGVFLVICTIVIAVLVNRGYSYKRNGIYGFGVPVKWEMDKTEVESLELGISDADSDKNYLSYDDITFAGVVQGDLFINFDEETDNTITTIQFEVTDSKTPEEIGDIISEGLGEPVHKENFNNHRVYEPKWMWQYDDTQYIILSKNTTRGNIYIDWKIADLEKVEKATTVLEEVKKDEEFNKAYNLFLERSKYEDASIEVVMEELGVTDYEIKEGSNVAGIYYHYDTVKFIESVEVFGFKGEFAYHCANPYDDDYPEFIGQVEYITFEFSDEITESEAKTIYNKIFKYTGRENSEDTNIYLPVSINYECDSPQSIRFSRNEDYYLINPNYEYDISTEEIEGYSDCDEELLHLDVDDTKHEISVYSDAADECWELTKSAVTRKLKVPSSASFPNPNITGNALFVRIGNIYQVTSYVEAENSFGAKIKTYFLVKIERNGQSYSVQDVIFKK